MNILTKKTGLPMKYLPTRTQSTKAPAETLTRAMKAPVTKALLTTPAEMTPRLENYEARVVL